MMRRFAVMAALVALAACAGVESAGRNARSAEPVMQGSTPPAASAETLPPPQAAPAPQAAAPRLAPPPAETAQAEPAAGADDDDDNGAIVVPGQREMQVPPPNGDPRSVAERMEDVRSWDRCVTDVQSAFEGDPMRPQLDTPEEYCSRTLGMADRTAVPASRMQRRR